MKKLIIYADGACKNNQSSNKEKVIGGWGFLILYTNKEGKEIKLERFNGKINTTNNEMELTAIIESLKVLKQSCEIDLYTDSKYAVQGMNEWIKNWIKNNWKGSNKQVIKNVELWKELDELSKIHKINFHWVKGHSTNEYNNRVDKLANLGCDKIRLF